MEHWVPQLESGSLPRERLHADRRISLIGWGIGLAVSLGLWAAVYYLIF